MKLYKIFWMNFSCVFFLASTIQCRPVNSEDAVTKGNIEIVDRYN